MFKNVGGQKLTVFCFDATTNLPKTGDAANLAAYVDKDDAGVVALGDTSATEKDATNAAGYYAFDLAQAETDADKLLFSAKSSTANVVAVAVPAVVYTAPPNLGLLAIDGSGRVTVGSGGSGSGGATPLAGVAVAGSTGAVVIVSGLPAGFRYVGEKLYNDASGEARIISGQSYASPNYTFTFAGSASSDPPAEDAPFSAVEPGDTMILLG